MSNNLFHLKSHQRENESGKFFSKAEDSKKDAQKPVNLDGLKEVTAKQNELDKNNSVSNMIQKSASQLPFVARIKNELMANSQDDNQSISDDTENYDY